MKAILNFKDTFFFHEKIAAQKKKKKKKKKKSPFFGEKQENFFRTCFRRTLCQQQQRNNGSSFRTRVHGRRRRWQWRQAYQIEKKVRLVPQKKKKKKKKKKKRRYFFCAKFAAVQSGEQTDILRKISNTGAFVTIFVAKKLKKK